MFKFGLHVLTWANRVDESALNYLPKLKEMGYDGCEVPIIPEHINFFKPAIIRKKLEELGMDCVSGTAYGDSMSIISNDPDVSNKGVSYLKHCIDLTFELGAKILNGTLYAPIGINKKTRRTQEQWDKSVYKLREVALYAAKKGIILCLEPINRYEISFLNTVGEAVLLVREIGERNVKVNIDTYHMNIEEKNIYETIINAGDLVGHVHCSENDRGIPGTGHFDWDGLLRGLLDINYKGWINIESFFEPIPEIIEVTPIWRKLAPDVDTLAREGLNFLKSKLVELQSK